MLHMQGTPDQFNGRWHGSIPALVLGYLIPWAFASCHGGTPLLVLQEWSKLPVPPVRCLRQIIQAVRENVDRGEGC